jgi:hypothetical protein
MTNAAYSRVRETAQSMWKKSTARMVAACAQEGVRAWDDLRLVGLKLIFLIVTRAVSLLGLSRREWWWKDAEILMLRHQLAVADTRAAESPFALDVAPCRHLRATRRDT